ncbi:MAG: F0F1 ATP synthase subunit epsilon [Phycisphaerales bacterium]|nr:F0F1 ATP synthase subunit epsilon [Phycisphaerales bacterium]
MAATAFECHVITPSGPVFEGQAQYVSFPAWDGQYGVMAGMAPILSRLGEGTLRIDGPQSSELRTRGGFAHVKGGTLTVLPDEIVEGDADATGGDAT